MKDFQHNAKLILPQYAVVNEDIHGRCIIEDEGEPQVRVIRGGNCKIRSRVVKWNSIANCTQVDFVIENVTTTCTYLCMLVQSVAIKTVPVVGMSVFITT